MRNFPYPDKELSREELTRDILYGKIPEDARAVISDRAWETGAAAAKDIFNEGGESQNIYDAARRGGLVLEKQHVDQIVGKVRYFSEYFPDEGKIVLYTVSIGRWAEKNGMPYDEAEEMILAHEYFHHLEFVKLGQTSRQYLVPTLKIGKWELIQSGIRALSEIGAHGFAGTYHEITRGEPPRNDTGSRLRNHAVNVAGLARLIRK